MSLHNLSRAIEVVVNETNPRVTARHVIVFLMTAEAGNEGLTQQTIMDFFGDALPKGSISKLTKRLRRIEDTGADGEIRYGYDLIQWIDDRSAIEGAYGYFLLTEKGKRIYKQVKRLAG
ncbi:hypothetical protein [Microbulbifer epialgicus]|uniref:Uncharacterized protein n=1 Tax=Microbulbifer epialgicus TaxID=393907 RepID=A0ABV4P0X1_9GAMM